LRRVWGVMWCLVVRTSQMSSASLGEGEEDVRKVFLEDEEAAWAALVEMCARRAVEALWSWGRLDRGFGGHGEGYLKLIQLVGRAGLDSRCQCG